MELFDIILLTSLAETLNNKCMLNWSEYHKYEVVKHVVSFTVLRLKISSHEANKKLVGYSCFLESKMLSFTPKRYLNFDPNIYLDFSLICTLNLSVYVGF